MKKKLIFCISILMCIMICASTVPFSAYIVDCPVDVTSRAVLVANLETDTFVYEKNSTGIRYLSYLTNIMTYIIARNAVTDIDTKVKIEKSVLDKIENPDNTLDRYAGKKLTVRDLLHFIMLTNGKDACYVLADYVCKGDIDEFVRLMNKKAVDLGCVETNFVKPYNVMEKTHYTTCHDMYKILKCALNTPDYTDIASKKSYVPDGYDEEKYTITTNNSILNPKSPYYFKHIKNSKYAIDSVARANIVSVSYYNKVRYACIIFGAQNENEHNAYTETKQLLSWTYLYLTNAQIFDDTDILSSVVVPAPWGEATVNLVTGKDIEKTMPAEYDSKLITYEMNDDIKVELPVFKGQNMGGAKVYYDGKYFDELNIVSDSSQGVGVLSDMSSFVSSMMKDTLDTAQETTVEETKVSETELPTEKPKKTNSKKTAETQTSTQAGQ